MNSSMLFRPFQQLANRLLHTTTALSGSVFMKKQKKVDPEVEKIRMARKRRKLEREIRLLQKAGKKPKPVLELVLDEESAANVEQLRRLPVSLDEDELYKRAKLIKEYAKSRNQLAIADRRWINAMFRNQDEALKTLRKLNVNLYEAAIQPDLTYLPKTLRGPTLTPPLHDYNCLDGEYINITKTYT